MQDEDYTICDDLGGFENTTYRNEIVMIEIYTCTEEDKYIEEDCFSFNRWSIDEWSQWSWHTREQKWQR